jgi:hypothetical protein
VRKVLPILALSTVLAFGGAACGDKTVTTAPPATQPAVSNDGAPASDANGAVQTADADLTEVDRLLRDIESDLTAVDQDASTPEGDPTA